MGIAHVDCDSFYASVEKRDNPALKDKAVIVGSSSGRGVVTTCCYNARRYGVRSAMPMYQAIQRCPDAVIVPPRFEAYREVSRQIREKFEALTPLVEPLSLDEAYLDLSATTKLHGAPPALSLARLKKQVRDEIGVTVSIGLSHAKFLAKIASDLEKPDGFSVIGKAETLAFLTDKPVGLIGGVGPAARQKLSDLGVETIGQLRTVDPKRVIPALGEHTFRLINFANGIDGRAVTPPGPAKSISNETTFDKDKHNRADLKKALWPLCEKVSSRAKQAGVWGETITLKLKTSDHKSLSRQKTVEPTQLAEELYQAASELLMKAPIQGYRLIGVGLSGLRDTPGQAQLFASRTEAAERVMDDIRARFGDKAIMKGRGL